MANEPENEDGQQPEADTAPAAEQRSEEAESAGFVVNDRRFWQLSDEELEQDGKAPGKPSYVEELEQQVKDKDEQLREYIKAYKNEVGDGLEQTKARLSREADKEADNLKAQLATPLLDVMEALERAVGGAQQSGNVEALVQGVQMVYQLMMQKLLELGLQRIDAAGKDFDPTLHEAVAVHPVQDAAHNNMVVQELRPGFMQGDKVVRPAQVLVGKLQ